MKIAVNTRFLIKEKLEGIGWFTYQSLKRITTQHPEHQFFFLFDRPYDDSFIFSKNITPVVISPPARHPLLWYYWFEYAVPKVLEKINPDIFISTDGYLSLSSKIKTLIVIHDLAFEHFPKHISWSAGKYYKHFSPKYARKADRIATVSEYSKKDITEKYNITPDKIDVVYNGSDELYQPLSESDIQKVQDEFTFGKRYLLFVGSIHPRKNLLGLLKAFELFKEKTSSDLKLVVAGRFAWKTNDIENFYTSMKNKEEVIFAGHCNLSKLAKLLGSAWALAYPSFFEGFGIPLVEAMNCHVPIITSNTSSMPEVAGEAAILIDPFLPEDIAEAIIKIDTQPELRNKLIEAGKKQKEKFSWELTAQKFWNSIEKTIN